MSVQEVRKVNIRIFFEYLRGFQVISRKALLGYTLMAIYYSSGIKDTLLEIVNTSSSIRI